MKKWKAALVGSAIASATLLSLAACGGETGESSKKKDDGSISLMAPDRTDVHPKREDLWMWNEYEKISGIKVNWEEVKDWEDKKQLIISKKTLPDAFYNLGFSNEELVKYGEQGLFIPLEDLIKDNAPNLVKLMEEDPTIKKAITSPDGHIYSLPYTCSDPMGGGRSFKMYFNKVWLEKLGLEVPTNTIELEEVLEAFVTKDPNGNGKADEQGYYMDSAQFGPLELMVKSAFGLNSAGRTAMENNYYLDKNGKLQFVFSSNNMKEVWKYEANLYKKGLIAKTAFAGVDYDKWVADASKDTVGMFSWVGRDFIGTEAMNNYVPTTILNGPDGTGGSLVTQSSVMGTSSFVITKDAADPEKLIKWVDYFYGPEGTELGFFGKEGVTYEAKENGDKVYVDKILNYPKGPQLGAYQFMDNVYGGFYPYNEPTEREKEIAYGRKPEEYTDAPLENLPEVILPTFMSTSEETLELSTITTDMNKYIEQARVQFVTGKWDVDEKWDEYLTQLKNIGLDKWVEIRQAQYARYMEE